MKSNPIPHRIVKKLKDGKYQIAHDDRCLGYCNVIHSVKHAPWIVYDQIEGKLSCHHCGTVVDLPCPSVRAKVWSKEVYMRLEALENDLWYFQVRHENCAEPPSAPASESDGSSSTPDHTS